MPCWDDCGYTWRAVGESTGCTRYINDGIVNNAQLTVEILAIRYDTGCVEPCYHEFDAIVKIYELYTGDASETLVYENVDTFKYNSGKVYYKHNEWEVLFNGITESPSEVNIIIKHKELCPGCTHPYICDCENTIALEQTAMTYAPAATNNPDAEWIYVKLLEVEYDGSSIRVEIEIWRDGSIVYTDASTVINNHGYIDISNSSTEHDWRVACNETNGTSSATVQLCFNFNDTGSGGGSAGSDLIAVQYFNTTGLGYTGGVIIYAEVVNPLSGGGYNTAPSQIKLELYNWDIDYNNTINGSPIVTEIMIPPSEKAHNGEYWIPFIWNYDLPEGRYVWSLSVLSGPHDGSFGLVFIDHSSGQRWSAWVNGYSHRNFRSKLMGLNTTETWEKITNNDDSFYDSHYECLTGYNKIKTNTSGGYKNVMTTKKDSNLVKVGRGSVTGTNLSFETGTFDGWTNISYPALPASISTNWSSNGTYSCKFSLIEGTTGLNTATIIQNFVNHSYIGGGELLFDLHAVGVTQTGIMFRAYSGSTHDQEMTTGTFLNVSVSLGTYINFKVESLRTDPVTCSIYVDNVRLNLGPDTADIPVGRIVGGCKNVKI